MITFLEGTLEEKSPARAVLNVGGVGYEVFIPLSTYDHLPARSSTCRMLIYEHIREDNHALYGFLKDSERGMFERMLSVSGVGPRIALSALSGLTPRELKKAVTGGDTVRLSSISGIGKKMAERLIVELKDKITEGEALEASMGEGEGSPENMKMRDAVLALISLGYRQADAFKLIQKVAPSIEGNETVEDVVRKALVK